MSAILNFFKKIPYRTIYVLKAILLYKNPLALPTATFFPNQKKILQVKLQNGLNFFLRNTLWDFFVLNEIMIKNEYQVFEKDFSSPKTVIDVGAHIGGFSVFFANKFKKAKFYCFEPMPQNFSLLEKNISANNLGNRVFPFNNAVVGKKEKSVLPLFLCEDNPACNSLDEEYISKNAKKVLVKTVSFSEVFQKNNITECDFLKLDCENTELDIIKNSKKEFEKVKAVVLEYHDPKNLSQIKTLLESYGFKFSLLPGTILAYGKKAKKKV